MFGLAVNGVLYLGLFLLPPSPDRVGIWFWIYMVVFPYLGFFGLWGLLQSRQLNLPWSIGALVLSYVLLLTLWANSLYIGLAGIVAWLPAGSSEVVHIALFALTLAGIIYILRTEYYW